MTKYYTIKTIGEGFHAGRAKELTVEEFYIALGEAFARLVFKGVDYNYLSTSKKSAWFQFNVHDEDDAGVAFFYLGN